MSAKILITHTMRILSVALLTLSLAGCLLEQPEEGGDLAPGKEATQLPPGNLLPGGSMAYPKQPTSLAPSPAIQTPAGYAGPEKPVCFVNTGTVGATVLPWTYIPLNSETAVMPPLVSTVAFPLGNSSACLSLPLGEYSWCFSWELGDPNQDGVMDYAHSLYLPRVLLDETDSDDLDLAEKVTLSAPGDLGVKPGQCSLEAWNVLDIRPFIVDSRHLDAHSYGSSIAVLAHLSDFVTLKGPVTVEYINRHCDASPCTTPAIIEPPVRVVIPAGETHQFYLEEWSEAHPGNWDMYVQLISIDG